MATIRLGVLGCSSFAGSTMLPGAVRSGAFRIRAVASRDPEKAHRFAAPFGAEAHGSYEELLLRKDLDAVYLPLPAALHTEWARRALDTGLPVLVEKPFALDEASARSVLELAKEKNLAVMENFMFPLHDQFTWIRARLDSGELGELRSLHARFTIPGLRPEDIRLDSTIGGGALHDVGCYPIRIAQLLLGASLDLEHASLSLDPLTRVDVEGSASLRDSHGRTAELFFGFRQAYQCSLELWGSRARLTAHRLFTAKPGVLPKVVIEADGREQVYELASDDQIVKAWLRFRDLMEGGFSEAESEAVLRQAQWLERIRSRARIQTLAQSSR